MYDYVHIKGRFTKWKRFICNNRCDYAHKSIQRKIHKLWHACTLGLPIERTVANLWNIGISESSATHSHINKTKMFRFPHQMKYFMSLILFVIVSQAKIYRKQKSFIDLPLFPSQVHKSFSTWQSRNQKNATS